jgi:cytidine deaminase
MISEIVQRFQTGGLFAGEFAEANARAAAAELVSGSRRDVLAGTQVLNVIEYGRAVHAEMAAITDAARRGVSIQDSTLYCTTFPCHLCAKHIIAAGIKRVVYIEPYPKSAAAVLFKDSMVVDPEMPVVERVSFESFVGIAPSVYSFMFRVGDTRKSADGMAAKWEADARCEPRFTRFVLSYFLIEDLVTAQQIPSAFVGEYAIMGAPPGSNHHAR